MADEKNEEMTKEVKAPEAPAAPQAAPAEASPAAAAPAEVKAEKKEAPPVVKEKPANCAGCKKSIKNKRWYYRNGKYYCTKRCWGTTNKKPAKTEETPQKA
jgi:hypothetical protein